VFDACHALNLVETMVSGENKMLLDRIGKMLTKLIKAQQRDG